MIETVLKWAATVVGFLVLVVLGALVYGFAKAVLRTWDKDVKRVEVKRAEEGKVIELRRRLP